MKPHTWNLERTHHRHSAQLDRSAIKPQLLPIMKSRLSALLNLAPVALLALASSTVPAAADTYFLKLDGIPGESTDSKHKGEIDILSFSWGMSNSGSFSGGGGGAGKANLQDLSLTTQLSKASPKLYLACATGDHIKKATLTVRKQGKEAQEYYIITLEDVLVSGVQTGGAAGSSSITESLSLNFSKITWTYFPQKVDGSLDTKVEHNWSVKENQGG